MITKKPTELKVNDSFIDPRREDRRPAKVISITGTFTSRFDGVARVHFELNDEKPQLGPWTASYGIEEDLEIC